MQTAKFENVSNRYTEEKAAERSPSPFVVALLVPPVFLFLLIWRVFNLFEDTYRFCCRLAEKFNGGNGKTGGKSVVRETVRRDERSESFVGGKKVARASMNVADRLDLLTDRRGVLTRADAEFPKRRVHPGIH